MCTYIRQKSTLHCKAIFLHIKINFKKRNKEKKSFRITADWSNHFQSPDFPWNVCSDSALGVVRSLGHDLVSASKGEKRFVWIIL